MMDIVRNPGRMRRWAVIATVLSVGTLTAACSSNSTSSTTTTSAASVPAGLSVSSFNSSFTEMPQFKGLTAAGKGLVGVILPDTTSSTRYVSFDAPYLAKAFQQAEYSSSQYKMHSAQGGAPAELAAARADISLGATVLVFDPLDSTVGAQVQASASSHGVAVISYDRATFTGTKTYYVSFDNVQVGKLIGQGFESCVTAWGITSPDRKSTRLNSS